MKPTSRVRADMWQHQPWNCTEGRMLYWVKRAIKPGATQLAKGAARCFWSIALQNIGGEAAHRALYLAGIDCPDFLLNEQPAGALPVKRQHRERMAA